MWLVDELYYLYDAANDRDYGQEILLNVTENNSEDLVVATTGYMDRMDQFFCDIHGMMSWIGNHIDFPKYTSDELNKIATVMARDLEGRPQHRSAGLHDLLDDMLIGAQVRDGPERGNAEAFITMAK